MLNVNMSNRLSHLASALLEQWAVPLADPLTAEQVIVPSAGMRRWLEMQLARSQGITANVHFSFPAHWIWRIIGQVVGAPVESPLAKEVLTWRIWYWLHQEDVSRFDRLGEYLRCSDELMIFELSQRLAALFDRYITYRPDWLATWASGKPVSSLVDAHIRADALWQAALWRHILHATAIPAEHPGQSLIKQLQVAGDKAVVRYNLPRRLAVFGVPVLPPLYLDILDQLSNWMEVSVFALSPCAEFWFDVESPRRAARREVRSARSSLPEASGNTLLALWGGQVQTGMAQLVERCEGDFNDGHVVTENSSLLNRLQNAVLHLHELAPLGAESLSDDGSICFHAAHGMMRELEILHDQLLLRFRADPTLTPADVMVVTPDLESAAPLIDAVFGAIGEDDARHVPYCITGRAAQAESALWEHFSSLCNVGEARAAASELFAWLEYPPLARRFGVDLAMLPVVKRWWSDGGVRWGLTANDWVDTDADPETPTTFSLDDGLRRMFLGFAMPTDQQVVFDGCLAYEDIEGQLAQTLGGVWRFANALQVWRNTVRAMHTMDAWREHVLNALQMFYEPLESERPGLDRLVQTVTVLARRVHSAAAEHLVLPVRVLQGALAQQQAAHAPGGVPTAQVTFSAMSSLRGLPYRWVCCVGMNHDAFPANAPMDEFDLMAIAPRLADPQRRRDDRNAFLDLLLAAKEGFYVSFTGRSIRDNSPLPPSVVVADLLDYLVAAQHPAADAEDRARLRDAWITVHPLQPFSRRYFQPQTFLHTFNHEYREALLQSRLDRPVNQRQDLFNSPLPAPEAEWRQVALEDLVRFFGNPARYFLQRRLGVDLALRNIALQDEETFAPTDAMLGELQERLCQRLLNGQTPGVLLAATQLQPELGGGRLSEVDAMALLARAERLTRQVQEASREASLPEQRLRFSLDEFVMTANLRDQFTWGQVCWTSRPAWASMKLSFWLRHLVLCATPSSGSITTTRCITGDQVFSFAPVTDAQDLLLDLLRVYWQGLLQPLRFFPRAALAYVERDGNLEAARAVWESSTFGGRGESEDPYYALAFAGQGSAALTAEFEALANRIAGPLQAALRKSDHVDAS